MEWKPQPASREVLEGYQKARAQLAQFQAPLLVGAPKPHGRVFVAAFDGTGNDKDKLPDEKTNVAEIYEQIRKDRPANVGVSYQPGVGTQDDDFIKVVDGALGYSYGPRMEQMYYDFCVQAEKWIKEDPRTEISLAAVGFSRGAVTAALFTRMVEERGVQNPDGMIIERGPDGLVSRTTPTLPPLVPPGLTPQIVGLFDPVATGVMNQIDVRLPPSVVSGFQITALHEYRDAFKSKQIIDPGMSADGRFLAVRMGGAHSNIGGSYLLNGLAVRNGNLMAAYLNATSDQPFLLERPVPTAPEMNVIHDSTQHEWFYSSVGSRVFGERRAIERLTPPASNVAQAVYQRAFSNTDDAEPRSEALNQPLRYRHVPVGPQREDPTLPDFYKKHLSRLEERAAIEASKRNFVPPAEPLIFRDAGAREEYDLREQLLRKAPYLSLEAGHEPLAPAPSTSLPVTGMATPLREGPQTQASRIPTLDTMVVHPGPELIPGSPAPAAGAFWGATPPAQTPTVPSGYAAPQIATLQSGLIQLGYHHRVSQPLQVNGVFDNATQQAVTAFQAQQNLPITSTFDLATQQALHQMLREQQIQQDSQWEREQQTHRKEEAALEPLRGEHSSSEALRLFSDAQHPQHALYADVKERLEVRGHALPEDRLHHITAQLHTAGFKAGWEGSLDVYNQAAYALDERNLWGGAAKVPLSEPAPPMHASLQTAHQHDQLQASMQAEFTQRQQMERYAPQQGPVLG